MRHKMHEPASGCASTVRGAVVQRTAVHARRNFVLQMSLAAAAWKHAATPLPPACWKAESSTRWLPGRSCAHRSSHLDSVGAGGAVLRVMGGAQANCSCAPPLPGTATRTCGGCNHASGGAPAREQRSMSDLRAPTGRRHAPHTGVCRRHTGGRSACRARRRQQPQISVTSKVNYL